LRTKSWGLKRWLITIIVGILLFSASLVFLVDWRYINRLQWHLLRFLFKTTGQVQSFLWLALPLLGLGLFLIIWGFYRLVNALVSDLGFPGSWPRRLYKSRHARRGPKIVVVGGGTGLSSLLRGLKEHTTNLSAIVTVADDGGSSGRLREEMGILPPGDVRNCLLAMADAEPLLNKLFQYRFTGDEGALAGHNFGNLFLAAMSDVTGDFLSGIKECSRVLAVRGQVLPSTLGEVYLEAKYTDGSTIRGEHRIPQPGKQIERVSLVPADAEPLPEALEAIAQADLIVLGPGSLYTSIIPNLLVGGITRALVRAKAPKVYVCNVMTQPGESEGYSAPQHVEVLVKHSHRRIIDYVLLNSDLDLPQELLEKYKLEDSYPVEPKAEEIRKLGYTPIEAPIISKVDLLRHDPIRLAQAIMDLFHSRCSKGK
jgi:uncharacterized cofD-like protein